MLVIETKEEHGLACLNGRPSHIKTTEFAPTTTWFERKPDLFLGACFMAL